MRTRSLDEGGGIWFSSGWGDIVPDFNVFGVSVLQCSMRSGAILGAANNAKGRGRREVITSDVICAECWFDDPFDQTMGRKFFDV
jgi:hypothetical protein